MTIKEIHEGIGGNGNPVWIVATVNAAGDWIWQEIFSTKAEALSWMKYA